MDTIDKVMIEEIEKKEELGKKEIGMVLEKWNA